MKPDHNELYALDKESLVALIVQLGEVVTQQAARIQELEDQLGKHSRNSGKPPSSDGLKKPPRRRSLREKGKRKTGGQQGHTGYTLAMVAEPDQVERHVVTMCPHCQADLQQVAATSVERRQVFDVPPVRLEVMDHQAEIKCCPCCGETVTGAFPPEATQPVQYGPRLQAQAVYLNHYQLLPLGRIKELFADFYGHAPSEALTLTSSEALVAQLAPALQAIKAQLTAAAVIHRDESGLLRVEGKLHWLHSASTPTLTYYAAHRKRGQVAQRDLGILPTFGGRAVHDTWASYFQFGNCDHALGSAHHLRELQFIVARYQQTWAQELFTLLLDIKKEVATAPPEWGCLPPDRLAHYEQRYDALLAQGLAVNPPPALAPPGKRGSTNNLLGLGTWALGLPPIPQPLPPRCAQGRGAGPPLFSLPP
ncbi:MAG: IS66 family transposase, partial [Chloroflexota bacterium]